MPNYLASVKHPIINILRVLMHLIHLVQEDKFKMLKKKVLHGLKGFVFPSVFHFYPFAIIYGVLACDRNTSFRVSMFYIGMFTSNIQTWTGLWLWKRGNMLGILVHKSLSGNQSCVSKQQKLWKYWYRSKQKSMQNFFFCSNWISPWDVAFFKS